MDCNPQVSPSIIQTETSWIATCYCRRRCELSEKQRVRDQSPVYEVWVGTARPRLASFQGFGSPEQRVTFTSGKQVTLRGSAATVVLSLTATSASRLSRIEADPWDGNQIPMNMEAGSSSIPPQCGDQQNTTMEETPHGMVDLPAPSRKAGDTSHPYSNGGEVVEASALARDAGSRSSSVDRRQVTLSSVKHTKTGAGLISAPINGVEGIMADIAQGSPFFNSEHTQVMENHPSSKELETTTDDSWTVVGRRKRKKLPPRPPDGTTSKPSRRLTQNVTTQRRTFILRPHQRVHVPEIAPHILEAVHKAMDSGGFPLDLRIRTKEDANTIAIDVWNPSMADRILAATDVLVQVGKRSVGFQAYKAAGPNQARDSFTRLA
ncbi:hypothetical protein HPB47_007468 [Ixodes persulcatus]|uniref:Uncharacterized protein n=1 Tax=Ixodes persulcatus TaxID=34615 RepID=A0AC60P7R3_IXOPE|nr:hypothetical protein HPB47_007468 [Ixodes persulcatus]